LTGVEIKADVLLVVVQGNRDRDGDGDGEEVGN